MKAAEMIELRCRRPFVPFVIHLKDGTLIHVDVSHVIATGRNSNSCVVHDRGGIRFVAYRDIAEIITVPVNEAEQEWL